MKRSSSTPGRRSRHGGKLPAAGGVDGAEQPALVAGRDHHRRVGWIERDRAQVLSGQPQLRPAGAAVGRAQHAPGRWRRRSPAGAEGQQMPGRARVRGRQAGDPRRVPAGELRHRRAQRPGLAGVVRLRAARRRSRLLPAAGVHDVRARDGENSIEAILNWLVSVRPVWPAASWCPSRPTDRCRRCRRPPAPARCPAGSIATTFWKPPPPRPLWPNLSGVTAAPPAVGALSAAAVAIASSVFFRCIGCPPARSSLWELIHPTS